MGNLNTINNELKSILSSVQLSGHAAFAEVTDHPTNKFSGYPAVSILPAPVPSQYATVAQNQRAYGFSIDMYVGIDQEPDWTAITGTMRDLVDAVLDALDQTIDLNATCDLMNATGVQSWQTIEAGQGLELWSAITVVAKKDVAIR